MTGHELHHPSVTELIKPAINFSLFAALIVYAARGPVGTYFRERTEKIRRALDAGRTAKAEAAALQSQLERDTADLPGIRARMVAELRDTAERERALLLEKAAATAERIREDARLAAAHEAEAARAELREATVQQAIAEATRLVRQTISADDQIRAAEEFVQSAGAT